MENINVAIQHSETPDARRRRSSGSISPTLIDIIDGIIDQTFIILTKSTICRSGAYVLKTVIHMRWKISRAEVGPMYVHPWEVAVGQARRYYETTTFTRLFAAVSSTR